VWKHVHEAFANELDPHFKIEEQHLLPGLEAIGQASLADRIREDHSALRALLRSAPVNRLLLKRFGELLEAHIRFEERQVFEPTQHLISAKVLEAIASACDALPRVCSTSLESQRGTA
jgi:hemerythrin-like domain-containing protein